MSIIFEPQIELPSGAIPPDTYDTSIGGMPPDNHVVSRHRDGTVASIYIDPAWNMSAYHPEERSSWFYFSPWKKNETNDARIRLIRVAQWLTFCMLWFKRGPTLSIRTLNGYVHIFKLMVKYSDLSGCQIQDVLNDAKRLKNFADSYCSKRMETLGAVLTALTQIGSERLGFPIIGAWEALETVLSKSREYRASLKQHPPLPTRIYSSVISTLSQELSDWLKISDAVLPLLPAFHQNPFWGRDRTQQYHIAEKLGAPLPLPIQPDFDEIIPDSVKKYLKTKGIPQNVTGLRRTLFEVQMAARLTIQSFTGMRDDEARTLPYHCLETTTANGKTHYIVYGRTTKFNNARIKRARWVTNRQGYQAIQIAMQIADAIYAACGVTPKKEKSRTNNYPLFVSPNHLSLGSNRLLPKSGRFAAVTVDLSGYEALRERLQPRITKDDLKELKKIDPHRAWESEAEFKAGNLWILTSHQLRRSLALYAQRSGLVSLPSLRRQLQHITEEMSLYYARGSAFASNFIGDDKKHFGKEWQRTQPVSAALSYINVWLSGDTLFGGHANWFEVRQKGPDGVILIDREDTIRRFNKGEMAYRATPLGGCTKIGKCDQQPLQWLNIDCLRKDCKNMVGNLKSLERVIKAQEGMVKTIEVTEPGSVEHRMQIADLEFLVAKRNEVMQQHKGHHK